MGLDILVCFDNNDEIYSSDYHDEKFDHFHKHSLSRTFCNFMCRKDAVSGEPELDQIGRITSVDISPIYEMENYGHGEELEFFLETAETEEQRQNIINLDKASKEKLKGNIEKVIVTVTKLIDNFSHIDNLPNLLNHHGWDSLKNKLSYANIKQERQGFKPINILYLP